MKPIEEHGSKTMKPIEEQLEETNKALLAVAELQSQIVFELTKHPEVLSQDAKDRMNEQAKLASDRVRALWG